MKHQSLGASQVHHLTLFLCLYKGRVLTQNLRGELRCPTCRQPHTFSEAGNIAAVPRNFALVSSLQRLQQRGAAGGLLAPESLFVGERLPGTAGTAAVYAGTLNLHNRQVQVWRKTPCNTVKQSNTHSKNRLLC